jgi:hypothetical protein
MENQIPNQTNITSPQADLQAIVREQRKRRNRNILFGFVAIACAAVLGYFAYTMGPVLFKAEITEVGAPAGVQKIYIPSYTAGAGDMGKIAIKANLGDDESIGPFDSITFTLTFNPVNALIFDNNAIVFDADTKIQSSPNNLALTNYNSVTGKLDVTIAASEAVTLKKGDIIFKLNTQINPNLATSQVITMGIENFGLFSGMTKLTGTGTMVAGTIILESADQLKVLNAETTGSTHVTVRFSDFLKGFGSANDYKIYVNNNGALGSPLAVTTAELGTDQKSVKLTTASQTAGTSYVVVATGNAITGNTQGILNTDYDAALFYGYGQPSAALSDFSMVSASATDYKTVVVTFTDNVKADSVSASDFTVTDMTNVTTINPISVSGAAASGKTVILTVAGPAPCATYTTSDNCVVPGCIWDNPNCKGIPTQGLLLKKNTYLIKTAAGDSVSRDSDGASLGINAVAFSGKDNGPILQGATITSSGGTSPEYTLQLAFAPSTETIAYAGITNNPIGDLYVDGALTSGILINDLSGYNQQISANKITLKNPVFGNSTKLFTFTISDSNYIKNALGVPSDESFKTISFWGYGHTEKTVGAVTIKNKKTIQVEKGNFALSEIISNDQISVVYENPSGSSLAEQTITSFNIDASGNLNIIFAGDLKPNISYILRLKEGGAIIVSKRFYLEQTLSVVSAEAKVNNQVIVGFSDNIDEGTVDLTDFAITPTVNITAFDVQDDFKHVALTTGAMNPNTVYTVNAANGPADPIYAYSGKALGNSIAAFKGYGTAAAQSGVTLSGVQNVSSTQVQLNFSGAVDPATVTPVNVRIVKAEASADTLVISELTISNVTGSGNSYTLTTSKQEAGINYFVIMNGVTDAGGKILGNAKVLNFFGFELAAPVISSVIPNSVTNNLEQNVTLSGQNLGTVQTVKVGSQTVTIVNKTATSLTIVIPKDFATGSYDITLIDNESQSKVFSKALIVLAPKTPMQVISEQSKSIPLNVPNDGQTKAVLWVLVYDTAGIANISSVAVNLSQIGGSSTQAMAKDTGKQPEYSQWYTYEVAVPKTVATKTDPYLLPVEVRKGSDTVTGTVSIHVTGDVYQSVAPTINQVYVSPVSVPPDGKTSVKISAQVSDTDGAGTITSVVADLGSLGIGFIPLTPLDTGEGSELVTRFYQSEDFTVASTVKTGQYKINVTASDSTGESAVASLTLSVSTQLTGPVIDSAKSYVAPRKSIPNDGKTAFDLYAYITDPDGIGDITSVNASFGDLGISPTMLLKDSSASDTAKSAYFSVKGLTIPRTAPLGVHSIEIIAEDSTGGLANYIMQIDVTAKDIIGDPPMVIKDKGYTTPKVAINDGQTPITLYVFVRDDDDDLESVVANLSQIGQVGPETGPDLSETNGKASAGGGITGGACPTGSNVMVCMNPSVKEGNQGQWFILPGVTISKSTMPSSEPYTVDIIASDITGKTTHGSLPVYVNNGESFTNDRLPPEVVVAVPTGATTVEVLFSEEISATSVSPNGAEFTITDKDDVSKKLNVIGATINAIGTIVTLTTENQVAGKQYVLTASSGITDAIGVSLVAGAANRVFFNGFQAKGKVPVIDYVTAMDVDLVEIEFADNLKPSTLKLAPVTREQAPISAGDFNIEIFGADTGAVLPVRGVSFGDNANTLLVLTDPQTGNEGYRVQVKDIASYDGKKSDAGASKTFKGYNLRTVQRQAAANLADLDGNGVVDFSDFTIFSSVYGTVYYQMTQNAETSAQTGGQPITPEPDALVPVTSEPTGEDVIPIE